MLKGKVAVVTGSGRGLGRAYAEAMARAGASVVVNDVDADAAEDTVRAIDDAGGRAVAEIVEVGTSEAADRLVDRAVREFGQLDVMVTNAGVLRDRTLRKTTDDDFDTVLRTHLRGTFTCARAAVNRFRAQDSPGRLILVGSPAGQRASFGQTSYSAAKAAIVGLVRTWAWECERAGVTVNAVVPTALTRMVATIPGLGEAVADAEAGRPIDPGLRRAGLGTPDDAAAVVVYLAGDAAAGVTGQCVSAGGDKIALWSHPQEVAAAYRDGGWDVERVAAEFPGLVEARLQSYKPEAFPVPPTGGRA
ncbi:SDR family oxidoreductase [Spiractinospora alimapuensis]|uniref:SDR family NAD(P)-dependent oxidoreductase n=1 Tax=Spiractinospora alimapuensis TaxID=2820884 RepID=UPI001F22A2D8|nr:SDR family oxidoreductase [Spiractinospora alimapuensis]QVQ52850.1 SDR family oxidoreductase [Spiractinospora alimapuensis]